MHSIATSTSYTWHTARMNIHHQTPQTLKYGETVDFLATSYCPFKWTLYTYQRQLLRRYKAKEKYQGASACLQVSMLKFTSNMKSTVSRQWYVCTEIVLYILIFHWSVGLPQRAFRASMCHGTAVFHLFAPVQLPRPRVLTTVAPPFFFFSRSRLWLNRLPMSPGKVNDALGTSPVMSYGACNDVTAPFRTL